jgi:hypothetical protein
MASLYLGKIGDGKQNFEIHAFTSGLPFREYPVSAVSDEGLFNKMHRSRYRLLEEGRSIFCTGINPNAEEKTESNPHDSRAGCIHIASLDENGEIACGVSIAVDTGEKDGGTYIGLPLENRWKPGNYPLGKNLDPFRQRYPRLQWGTDRALKPWEMAEFYRHFKSSHVSDDLNCRLGLYAAGYHLLVRNARTKNKPATPVWVFDAIPKYFTLYKWAGCAALREQTIADEPEWISPSFDKVKSRKIGSEKMLFYKDRPISRTVTVPIARIASGKLSFSREEVPFLDGVIDLHKLENLSNRFPYLLVIRGIRGFSPGDRVKLLLGLNIIGRKYILEDATAGNKHIRRLINRLSCTILGTRLWEFRF